MCLPIDASLRGRCPIIRHVNCLSVSGAINVGWDGVSKTAHTITHDVAGGSVDGQRLSRIDSVYLCPRREHAAVVAAPCVLSCPFAAMEVMSAQDENTRSPGPPPLLPPRSPLRARARPVAISLDSEVSVRMMSNLIESMQLQDPTDGKLPLIPQSPSPLSPVDIDDASSTGSSILNTPPMNKRTHALLELLSSERAYASDLALIRDIHIPLALGPW
jgi:hypothetical protein